MRARILVAALLCAVASRVLADGGRLRAHGDAGEFRIAIFTSPEPLTAGKTDVSVLVQQRSTAEVVMDAEVTLALAGPGGATVSVPAGRHARNRLFHGATVDLGPGRWAAVARVRRGRDSAEVFAVFEVGEARPIRAWPYLSIPPVAVAIFAANRGLRRRQRRQN